MDMAVKMSDPAVVVRTSPTFFERYSIPWRRGARRRNRWGTEPISFAFDFSGDRLAMRLDEDEAALIDFFRTMTDVDRLAMVHIARSMAERAEASAAANPRSFQPPRPSAAE